MISDVGKDRLTRLVKLLRANADNPKGVKFDMSSWTWGSTQLDQDRNIPLDCRTSACAFGLAALSGEFRADGLEATVYLSGSVEVTFSPNGEPLEGFGAAAAFFEINNGMAQYLFDPEAYAEDVPIVGAQGERYVAARIEQFVNSDGEAYG